MVLQGGEGPLGQGLAPQLVGQAFLGHVVAARHQEQLEHLLGLGAAEVSRAETALTRCHLDGAEQPGPHRRRLRSRTGRTHGVIITAQASAAQGLTWFYNRARTGAAPETEATVTVSQEQAPEPPGRYREVMREVSRRSRRDADGRLDPVARPEEHKIQMLQELAEAT